MTHVLLVDDDTSIVSNLRTFLNQEGFQVTSANNHKETIDLLDSGQYHFDLALLDVSLPDGSGFSLCSAIKANSDIPVIFLTARSDVADRVKGLKLGAEDYIVKPFEIIELLARIETVLRRYNKTARMLSVYDVTVDTFSRVVKKAGHPVALTAKEYDILLLFLRNKNIALFRDRIYESVWGEMYMGESRTVDLHVQRMRKKLGLESKIVPVYKIGYRLEVDE